MALVVTSRNLLAALSCHVSGICRVIVTSFPCPASAPDSSRPLHCFFFRSYQLCATGGHVTNFDGAGAGFKVVKVQITPSLGVSQRYR